VNFVAELPFGDGKRWATGGVGKAILGGWTLSGIYAARSGRPYTVNQGNNNVGTNMTGLPNMTGDGQGAQTVDEWFDKTGFVPVPSGTFGTRSATGCAVRAGRASTPASRAASASTRASRPSCAGTSSTSSTARTWPANRNISDAATVGTITSWRETPA